MKQQIKSKITKMTICLPSILIPVIENAIIAIYIVFSKAIKVTKMHNNYVSDLKLISVVKGMSNRL